MAPALFAHHLDRLLDAEGLAVDAVAGEGVEYVRHRDDSALDRDRLALQAPRIAAAVPLLLVAERDGRGHVQDRGGGAPHEPVALLGVGLDDRALLRRQRAGLQEDRVGDRDLADVMERSGVFEPLAELCVHPDVLSEQDREAADALDVRAGVLVPELDRHREALDRLGLCDLELGEGPFELARATADLGFQGSPTALANRPAECACPG